MKQVLQNILNNPDQYKDWPLYHRRMFWCVVEHYIYQDNEKFEALWKMVNNWANRQQISKEGIPPLGESKGAGDDD